MKYSAETMMSFYQKIGRVFYLVAAADKVVHQEEISALRKIVESSWLSFDSTFDEFGSDAAYQIEIVFDWLKDNNRNVNQAIPALKEFKNRHPGMFTKPVVDLIIKTAEIISSSFSGSDENESHVIDQLKKALAM
ncbi:MAG TPA: hypothetical protein VGD22_03510 [Sphingobacteriaceae bacterium]